MSDGGRRSQLEQTQNHSRAASARECNCSITVTFAPGFKNSTRNGDAERSQQWHGDKQCANTEPDGDRKIALRAGRGIQPIPLKLPNLFSDAALRQPPARTTQRVLKIRRVGRQLGIMAAYSRNRWSASWRYVVKILPPIAAFLLLSAIHAEVMPG